MINSLSKDLQDQWDEDKLEKTIDDISEMWKKYS